VWERESRKDLAEKEQIAGHHEEKGYDEAETSGREEELDGDAECVLLGASKRLQVDGLFVERVDVHDADDAEEVEGSDFCGRSGGYAGDGCELALEDLNERCGVRGFRGRVSEQAALWS
jgi:hypothetical protein